MKYKALAKINLGLDVVRKREDGYHEVRMIMQNIGLYDDLELTVTQEKGISVQTNREDLPTDEGNLVYKAAKLLMNVMFLIRSRITVLSFFPIMVDSAAAALPMWKFTEVQALRKLLYL